MRGNRFVVAGLVVFCGLFGMGLTKAAASPLSASMPPVFSQDRGHGEWETPPGELNEVQRQGFHDGIEGARKDAENHRRPDVNNRDEYKHPHVPAQDRRAYRDGFRRGYQVGISHLVERDRH